MVDTLRFSSFCPVEENPNTLRDPPCIGDEPTIEWAVPIELLRATIDAESVKKEEGRERAAWTKTEPGLGALLK